MTTYAYTVKGSSLLLYCTGDASAQVSSARVSAKDQLPSLEENSVILMDVDSDMSETIEEIDGKVHV